MPVPHDPTPPEFLWEKLNSGRVRDLLSMINEGAEQKNQEYKTFKKVVFHNLVIVSIQFLLVYFLGSGIKLS